MITHCRIMVTRGGRAEVFTPAVKLIAKPQKRGKDPARVRTGTPSSRATISVWASRCEIGTEPNPNSKNLENLKILAGILVSDSKANILSSGEVEALSKLPSREELLVKLLFLMQAPMQQFVRTLNAVPAKVVRTLAANRDSK